MKKNLCAACLSVSAFMLIACSGDNGSPATVILENSAVNAQGGETETPEPDSVFVIQDSMTAGDSNEQKAAVPESNVPDSIGRLELKQDSISKGSSTPQDQSLDYAAYLNSAVSSSSNAQIQNSVNSSSSSSFLPMTAPPCCGSFLTIADLWEGDMEFVVTWKHANESWADYGAGRWFVESDSEDGGRSSVTWPVDLGNEYNPNSFQPVIDYCYGLCGRFDLDGSTLSYDPYVAIGFIVAGFDSNGVAMSADVSNWGGICVGYSSSMSIEMRLVLGDSVNRSLEYDLPMVKMPKSYSGRKSCFEWSEFKRAGWGKGDAKSGDDASKQLVNVVFRIQGKTGSAGDFYIQSLGTFKYSR